MKPLSAMALSTKWCLMGKYVDIDFFMPVHFFPFVFIGAYLALPTVIQGWGGGWGGYWNHLLICHLCPDLVWAISHELFVPQLAMTVHLHELEWSVVQKIGQKIGLLSYTDQDYSEGSYDQNMTFSIF